MVDEIGCDCVGDVGCEEESFVDVYVGGSNCVWILSSNGIC